MEKMNKIVWENSALEKLEEKPIGENPAQPATFKTAVWSGKSDQRKSDLLLGFQNRLNPRYPKPNKMSDFRWSLSPSQPVVSKTV